MHLIPPTIEHDTRAKVGMGAKDGGVDFGDFDEWQQGNPRCDPLEVRAMWRSFKPGVVGALPSRHCCPRGRLPTKLNLPAQRLHGPETTKPSRNRAKSLIYMVGRE